jgi:hypothetical protein
MYADASDVSRADDVKAGSDRNFGLVVGSVLLVLSAYRLYVGSSALIVGALAAGGIALAGAALTRPAVLSPLNRLWFRLGLLLHKVTNPIFLGLIFSLAFVPMGALLRLAGRDLLRLEPDPSAATYWTSRETAGSTAESLPRPF